MIVGSDHLFIRIEDTIKNDRNKYRNSTMIVVASILYIEVIITPSDLKHSKRSLRERGRIHPSLCDCDMPHCDGIAKSFSQVTAADRIR